MRLISRHTFIICIQLCLDHFTSIRPLSSRPLRNFSVLLNNWILPLEPFTWVAAQSPTYPYYQRTLLNRIHVHPTCHYSEHQYYIHSNIWYLELVASQRRPQSVWAPENSPTTVKILPSIPASDVPKPHTSDIWACNSNVFPKTTIRIFRLDPNLHNGGYPAPHSGYRDSRMRTRYK